MDTKWTEKFKSVNYTIQFYTFFSPLVWPALSFSQYANQNWWDGATWPIWANDEFGRIHNRFKGEIEWDHIPKGKLKVLELPED